MTVSAGLDACRSASIARDQARLLDRTFTRDDPTPPLARLNHHGPLALWPHGRPPSSRR